MRAISIPVALTVLAGLPFVVVAPTKDAVAPAGVVSPAVATPAAPLASALTVQSGGGDVVHIGVAVVGGPPTLTSQLASVDGRDGGTVTAEDSSAMCRDPARHVAREEDVTNASPAQQSATEWCLKVVGLPTYGEVAGTLTGVAAVADGPSTVLTLTVDRRRAFIVTPMLLLLLGLMAGFAVAIVPPLLTTGIGRARLELLLALNERRSIRNRIGGLRDRAVARKAAGDDAEMIRAKFQPVVSKGPERARSYRKALQGALGGEPLGPSQPYAVLAADEARRTGHDIADFLTDDDEASAHPAVVFHAGIDDLARLKAEIAKLRATASEWLEPSKVPDQIDVADGMWHGAASPADIERVESAVATAQTALDAALADPMSRLGKAGTPPAIAGTRIGVGSPMMVNLDSRALALMALGALATLTGLCILVALVFAGVTVYVAAYDAKPTFGTFDDMFALFTAAVGSGVAATVLGLTAPWSDKPPADAK